MMLLGALGTRLGGVCVWCIVYIYAQVCLGGECMYSIYVRVPVTGQCVYFYVHVSACR